jgi:hypothetical protein
VVPQAWLVVALMWGLTAQLVYEHLVAHLLVGWAVVHQVQGQMQACLVVQLAGCLDK